MSEHVVELLAVPGHVYGALDGALDGSGGLAALFGTVLLLLALVALLKARAPSAFPAAVVEGGAPSAPWTSAPDAAVTDAALTSADDAAVLAVRTPGGGE